MHTSRIFIEDLPVKATAILGDESIKEILTAYSHGAPLDAGERDILNTAIDIIAGDRGTLVHVSHNSEGELFFSSRKGAPPRDEASVTVDSSSLMRDMIDEHGFLDLVLELKAIEDGGTLTIAEANEIRAAISHTQSQRL